MTLFAYITDQLRHDAQTMGVPESKLEAFAKDEVEQKQSTSSFDRFPAPFLTRKKIWAYNKRLIAAERRVGEHVVIILLRLLVKGNEYSSFENDPVTVGERYLSKGP